MDEGNFSSPLGFRGGLPLPENTRTGIAPSSARHVGTFNTPFARVQKLQINARF